MRIAFYCFRWENKLNFICSWSILHEFCCCWICLNLTEEVLLKLLKYMPFLGVTLSTPNYLTQIQEAQVILFWFKRSKIDEVKFHWLLFPINYNFLVNGNMFYFSGVLSCLRNVLKLKYTIAQHFINCV